MALSFSLKTFPVCACVYAIIFQKGNKRYIGQAINSNIRFQRHRSLLRNNKHFNKYLQATFNKYGSSEFNFEILEKVENVELLSVKEQAWANRFQSFDPAKGFNYGECLPNPFLGKNHSIETRKKLSEQKLGYKFPVERNLRISTALKGRKKSKEEIEAISYGARQGHLKEKKFIKLVSPEGELVERHGVKAFSREFHLYSANVFKLINSKQPHYKGWRVYDGSNLTPYHPGKRAAFDPAAKSAKIRLARLGKSSAKKWHKIIFRNTSGEEKEVKNLSEFCRENNLSQPEISKMANGRISEYKGWRVEKLVPKAAP